MSSFIYASPWDRGKQSGRGFEGVKHAGVHHMCFASVCFFVWTRALACLFGLKFPQAAEVMASLSLVTEAVHWMWNMLLTKEKLYIIIMCRCESKRYGLKLSVLAELVVNFKLSQLSWLLFAAIVLALQIFQSHLSAYGFLPTLRFGSGDWSLPEPLQRCVTMYYALIVMIGQVMHSTVTMDISSVIRWFLLSGSHSCV